MTDAENIAAPAPSRTPDKRNRAPARKGAGLAHQRARRGAAHGRHGLHDPCRQRRRHLPVADRARPLDGRLRFRHLCLGLDLAAARRRHRASRHSADRTALHPGIHPPQPDRRAARLLYRQPLDRLRARDCLRAGWRSRDLRARAFTRSAHRAAVLSGLRVAAVLHHRADVRRARPLLQLDRAGARAAHPAPPRWCCSR